MVMKKSYSRLVFMPLLLFLSMVLSISAASNVIDVTVSEKVFEEVVYNPLKVGGGLYFDANENQSNYTLGGEIVVVNNHPTEAVQDIVLNFTTIGNIYNLNNSAGREAFVTDFNTASDFMILYVPDLGPGQNATISYQINSSNVAPILNFTASYSDTKIFAGLPVSVVDRVENVMNASNYPTTCIYNINITQNALDVNLSGVILNFTFDSTTLAGLDSSNASVSADNRTINWNLWNGGCFNSGNSTNINYDVLTPNGINVANDYRIVNSTIIYYLNTSVSRISLANVDALANLNLEFQKYLNNTLTGDNATWRVTSNVSSPSNITVNLTQVTLWVSTRNGTGTGFTNPSIIDNDTITGTQLLKTYNVGSLLNNTLAPWSNSADIWFFNYTYSSSPIVWMDIQNNILNDGVQITNRSITYGDNSIYIKEIYIVTGYWLQISKNITRLGNNSYNVFIEVINLGTSPTPTGQIVQVYNFIPITFNLTSAFSFSTSTWYTTTTANETLTDAVYNGTMFQFGLLPNSNPFNSSLAAYGGASNTNNTWTVSYNVSGSGEFNFEDLFLTGVDPLNVKEVGSTKALVIESAYSILSNGVEVVLGIGAVILGLIVFLF